MLNESSRIPPESEAVRIMQRVAADHGDEGEREDDEDQDDFAARQPEFGFTKDFDGKDVEETNQSSQYKNSQSDSSQKMSVEK